MENKIYDSELKIMEILWSGGEQTAKDIALQAADQAGWSKTTTYTVLKKCVEKRTTVGAPGAEEMETVLKLYREELLCDDGK